MGWPSRGGHGRRVAAKRRSNRKSKARKLSVPEVWRTIVKKNERQGGKLYDIMICKHAVLANDNTYRKARSCPTCRLEVQAYADALAARRPA
jgi:hypothetical protein